MKILDKYVAKNFLIGYFIAFGVLIGLRIIIDLFINLDEFTENAHLGASVVVGNIISYYGHNSTLYFRDFAGMITVVAAAFSLGKMTRQNELTAVLASGVSLKRVIAPIVFLAIILTGVLVIDQEVLIPRLAEKLVLGKDDVPGQEHFSIWFLTDGNGSLVCSRDFDTQTGKLIKPSIITRKRIPGSLVWEVTGKITADSAMYDANSQSWVLDNGEFLKRQNLIAERQLSKFRKHDQIEPIAAYKSDLTPRDIPVLRTDAFKVLLSSEQLAALAQRRTQIKDLAQLYSQKHFRITDPIINLIMLMVGLPVLVVREPRTMKSAILKSFLITAACFLVTFGCKMIATESMFNHVMPEFWAWLPIFIFLPIALLEIDGMKT